MESRSLSKADVQTSGAMWDWFYENLDSKSRLGGTVFIRSRGRPHLREVSMDFGPSVVHRDIQSSIHWELEELEVSRFWREK